MMRHAINRYKEVVHKVVEHLPPQEILAKLAKLEEEIQVGMLASTPLSQRTSTPRSQDTPASLNQGTQVSLCQCTTTPLSFPLPEPFGYTHGNRSQRE